LLRKMWPTQLVFLHFIIRRIFISSLIPCNNHFFNTIGPFGHFYVINATWRDSVSPSLGVLWKYWFGRPISRIWKTKKITLYIVS
jgi:hypothetical protein